MKAEQPGRRHSGSARLIISYVQDTTETAFCPDRHKQDAVIRRIKIIGEANAHLTEETRHAFPQRSFRQMRGMRNIVAHDNGNVDPKTIWEVATIHVPKVCAVREKFFFGSEVSSYPCNGEAIGCGCSRSINHRW